MIDLLLLTLQQLGLGIATNAIYDLLKMQTIQPKSEELLEAEVNKILKENKIPVSHTAILGHISNPHNQTELLGQKATVSIDTLYIQKVLALNTGWPVDHFRPDAIQEALIRPLKKIVSDQWRSGEARGGWGIDYAPRYFSDLFGNAQPVDSVHHHHSITYSYWVLDGLLAVVDLANLCNPTKNINIGSLGWSDEISQYFNRFYDSKSGGVGPKWTSTDSTSYISPNARHASAGVLAFLQLDGYGEQSIRTSKYILDQLDKDFDWTKARGLSLSAILRALYAIQHDDRLQKGVKSKDNRLSRFTKHLETELASKFSGGTWGETIVPNSPETIWYAIFILTSIPQIQFSSDSDLRNAYSFLLESILLQHLKRSGQGAGLPYLTNSDPDMGMTSALLNILAQDTTLENQTRISLIYRSIYFILYGHIQGLTDKYSYSWTYATLYRALLNLARRTPDANHQVQRLTNCSTRTLPL